MDLLIVGINHETAPIAVRERVAFTPEQLDHALQDLKQNQSLDEVAILSTCNRTEIYAVKTGLAGKDAPSIANWLAEYHELPVEQINSSIYSHAGRPAVNHVMRVATGLDSMVLGEPQILGQLKDGFAAAQSSQVFGKQLGRLSQQTYRIAKKVRSQTAIGENPVSVASTAVDLASQLFADLKGCNALLIGAGETTELVGRHLKNAGIKKMVIANRTLGNAERLADELGATATTLAQIPHHLVDTDIVVASTAAQLPVLGKGTVESAVKSRRHKPIFMVDLAVPRDIESEVNDLKDVYLYTVDDLQQIISVNISSREAAAKDAEKLIEQALVEFEDSAKSLGAVDTLKKFRQHHDAIKAEELTKSLKRIENGDDPSKVLQAFANQLTNKIMHTPSVQLKQASVDGAEHLLTAVENIFQLDDQD